ncbi:MAG TPA: TlpA disulfide reductase family protein [Sunxiuqinia sp.]|nr:TlpA disulfide reductase family protein [Sunxiuqinia sp.]
MRKLLLLTAFFCFGTITMAVAQQKTLDVGDQAPEIKLATPDGDTIALSALRGKLVLIDFWATWCAPCVKEQPELGKLYRTYKNSSFTKGKGFEIYGVSLDNKKAQWENTIKKLNIDWIQVSDLKFWLSPVAKLYGIQGLPFNVLVDRNGVIIAKNLHGQELRQYIASMVVHDN